MVKVNVSYQLKPLGAQGLELKTALAALREQLKLEAQRQMNGIQLNRAVDCSERSSFSNMVARKLKVENNHPLISRQYSWDEMTRAEIWRLLSAWQQRHHIAQEQERHSYELNYSDRGEDFAFVKRQQWGNIQRSKKLPELPTVTRARMPLSKASSQYSWIYQANRKIELYLTTLAGDCYIRFEVPEKVWTQYAGWKATRPTMQLDESGEVTFCFTLEGEVTSAKTSRSTIGVDLGLTRAYAASSIRTTGEVEQIEVTSLEVERSRKILAKIDGKLRPLSAKNRRRKILGVTKETSIQEELTLRAKRNRVVDSLDWQIAKDVVELAEPGGTIALEDLRWSGGGPVKFRHGLQQSKIEHIAAKRGRRIAKVNAAYSSQECPICETRVKPGADRVLRCGGCGYAGDRDSSASVVIGKRAAKLKKISIIKGQATPKRPVPRRSLINFVRKTGFTGLSLDDRTGGVIDSAARLSAEYRSPIGTVGAVWQKRSTYW